MDKPDGAAGNFMPLLYLLLCINWLPWTNNQAPGFHLPQFPKSFHFVLPKCLQTRCACLTQGTWQSRASKSLHWLFLLINCLWRWKCCAEVSCSVMSDCCDPMDCSPPDSSVHGILQARTLEWVAISFSRGSSQPRDQTQVSRIAGGFFRHFRQKEHREHGGRAVIWSEWTTGSSASLVSRVSQEAWGWVVEIRRGQCRDGL